MFTYEYQSDFPKWTNDDSLWHKKLRDASWCQIAISTTSWEYLNKAQIELLLNNYAHNVVLIPRKNKNPFSRKIKVCGIFVFLDETIEMPFLEESQFGAMWDLLYLSETTVANVIKLINGHYPIDFDWISNDHVISTMYKVYNDTDAGPSSTRIVSKQNHEERTLK